ncbi:MAG: hypothetical protein HY812_07280 [Planctomycetes bacterium]|nr:hypothetical protein [Planctomycetota bacterium]
MECEHLILEAEAQLARRIALSLYVAKPRPLWQQAVPGMFLVEFLRRTHWIRRFQETYLSPRRRALAGAPVPPNERPLHDLLAEHYRRLLAAAGDDFAALVRAAYGERAAYEDFLRRLERVEEAADPAEAQRVRETRARHARELFQD